MSLEDALKLLDTCNWLKLSRTSVHACKYGNRGYLFDVQVRRLKGQSFAEMVIRAATLAQQGHNADDSRTSPEPW